MMTASKWLRILVIPVLVMTFTGQAAAAPASTSHRSAGWQSNLKSVNEQLRAFGLVGKAPSKPTVGRADNFQVLGHNDLGALDTNGDVWVHGNFAYVGTWARPCNGLGVKIIDVSDLQAPRFIGRLAARPGTSAEDMAVRHVSTPSFTGDLLAVGLQRCSGDPALDDQEFGAEFWNVTNPHHPRKLGSIGINHGGGGVHELNLFQRGTHVYALLAAPFSEWFDPVPGGDFRIVDVTNPVAPVQVGEWGAHAHGLSPGPYYGQGSFGSRFDHSARPSADGMRAYVSYWDLGVLTLDISNVSNPTLLSRTRYAPDADGDGHSVSSVYQGSSRRFLLQNDEDFDPRSPANIRYGTKGAGVASESPGGVALWLSSGHGLTAKVVQAANQGCVAGDYPSNTAGKIAVVRTPFPFFDPEGGESPSCLQQEQESAAAAAGATAVVHDFISTSTSPQWFDSGSVAIPVLFTDHATAQGMVSTGSARLEAQQPSWGFMRVFDAETGVQVAKFDGLPNVHALSSPEGDWSIHNNEVLGNRSYASWYTNGVVALDLQPLNRPQPGNPLLVGQFLPPGAPSHAPGIIPDNVPIVWGLAIRDADGDKQGDVSSESAIFVSDMNSGLWIVRPMGAARPTVTAQP
jgi:hypothetical protein